MTLATMAGRWQLRASNLKAEKYGEWECAMRAAYAGQAQGLFAMSPPPALVHTAVAFAIIRSYSLNRSSPSRAFHVSMSQFGLR